MSAGLDALAARHGIASSYHGLDGQPHVVPDATKLAVLAALNVPTTARSEPGAELPFEPSGPAAAGPDRCYLPAWLETRRGWGISVQLYALHSARSWGIGDFADLADFCRVAAAAGADFVGLNPLHAGFLAAPDRRSPFSPSSRRFLNPLYIAPDRVPGFDAAMMDAAALAASGSAELVDYEQVAAAKLPALRRLWAAGPHDPAAFAAFVAGGGAPLYRHALFEALSQHLVARGHGAGWESWPPDYAAPEAPGARTFAVAHDDEIRFHCWLQWLAALQLEEVQEVARGSGMRLGLYLDLAVGDAPDGSASWGEPELAMRGLHVGAPPDYFSALGQDWQLVPLSPAALERDDNGAFGALLESTMRYAGALRIDHAMSIQQLFVVPRGASPAAGTYLRYPTGAMLAAIAEASHANRTLVIGEDLGNVPEGFRGLMAEAGIFSYRILYFERQGDRFIAPDAYPRDALVCLSTHDLPTLEGWWRGDDIVLRAEHGLIDAAAAQMQEQERDRERAALLEQLQEESLLPAGTMAGSVGPMDLDLAVAVHRFIARTPTRLLAARLEDLVGQRRPTNLPGTIDSYPNWQLRLPLDLDEIAAHAGFRAITAALSAERPRP